MPETCNAPTTPRITRNEYPNGRHFPTPILPAFEGLAPASDDEELKYLYGNMPEDQWLEEVWLGKLKEVIDKYDPDIIWFDTWLDKIPEKYRREYLELLLQRRAAERAESRDDLQTARPPDDVGVFNIEKGGKKTISPEVWQSDDTVSFGSWSFTDSLKIKPVSMVVHGLIDIVSKERSSMAEHLSSCRRIYTRGTKKTFARNG